VSTAFRVGDRVELVAVPPGFTSLRVGQQGVVLMAAENAGDGEALATVRFNRRGAGASRPVRIAPRYLRRVSWGAPQSSRKPPEVPHGG
jgi:hypothetical protein